MTIGSRLAPSEVQAAHARSLSAMRMQEIEGNPLTPDEVAMFEMFEREAWPHEKCLVHILAKAKRQAAE